MQHEAAVTPSSDAVGQGDRVRRGLVQFVEGVEEVRDGLRAADGLGGRGREVQGGAQVVDDRRLVVGQREVLDGLPVADDDVELGTPQDLRAELS
ncbi:hypothetical protein [Streptomyces sp900105755]|uniref:Uncharacterized protein n=1 Tax=Streptomyces sp. 900105755 TaxID=3154389 RepID=A0ABV1TWZ1_9ACTN